MNRISEERDRAKILVVDDEKLVRLVMSARLRQAGYGCVAVGDVESAVAILKKERKDFSAVITDIVMGNMDGFDFRDIIRGIDSSMPVFFLTALDPEEGSGFLKRILNDPISYYMPKSVPNEVLIRRIKQVVASRRVAMFIEQKLEDDQKSMQLAANIQYSMLPVRSVMTPRGFYTSWWRPAETVSGDLYEAVPFGFGCYLYVLGDIQGHGTSAALAMTAVQSFLKTLTRREGAPYMTPAEIANVLQRFFRKNLADVSYMTALICLHRAVEGTTSWISCGAPDLVVIDGGKYIRVNPEKRGGMPIGMMPDTVYTEDDIVTTNMTDTAVCIAYTDGILDLSRDPEGMERLPQEQSMRALAELVDEAREKGTLPALFAKFMKVCEENGYTYFQDDVTLLTFSKRLPIEGVYEDTFLLHPAEIDSASQKMADWCRSQGWPQSSIGIVQLVLEEKTMNIYDHGFDDRTRLHEVASIRLTRIEDSACLTVWDNGTPQPSLMVATGDSEVAFEIANSKMSNHGRGRLMVRELCDMIEHNQYGTLNEAIYHIPLKGKKKEEANNA